MMGLDKTARLIVVALVALALLCLIGFGLSYCSRGDKLKAERGEKIVADGRTASAVEAIDTIAENTSANAATHDDVKEAQDAIRSIPAGPDRERRARCELRVLQGLAQPPC